MKVLQINNFHGRAGGAEVVYLNTIALLKTRNHEVVSFSTKNDSGSQADYYVEYSKSFGSRFYSINAVKKINEIIEKEKPQLAHIHNIIGGITYSILPVLKKYRVPVVASIHDYKLLCPAVNLIDRNNVVCQKCIKGKYFNCIVKNCSRNGRRNSVLLAGESYLRDLMLNFNKYINNFIFVSDFERNKFLEVYPELANRSVRIYNFTDEFIQNKNRGDYFLSFGRLSSEKGLLTLIEAFKNHPTKKLKIVGEGPIKDLLIKKKSENVELCGFKDAKELKELIQKAFFIVVPSECYETNSLTTVESFAMGKPVIASDMGALTELIKNHETGFIFRAGNSEGLSNIISESGNLTEQEYENYSEQAFTFASAYFSQDTHYEKLMEIYNTALGKKDNFSLSDC